MPINPNIALSVKPIQFESPVNQLANVLQIQGAQQANDLNRMKMDEYQRTADRQSKLQSLLSGLPQGASDDDRVSALRSSGYLDEADKVQTGVLNRRKTDSEIAGRNVEVLGKTMQFYKDNINGIKTPEQAQQWVTAVHSDPILKDTMGRLMPLEKAIASIPADPAGFQAWKDANALDAEKFITLTTPKVEYKSDGKTLRPVEMNPRAPGYAPAPITMLTTRGEDQRSADAAKSREQSQRLFNTTQERLNAPKPVGNAKTAPMSVTLQKELLESDDTVQSSKSVISTLQNALKINDKAYSGYGAKARATLTSNLGGSEAADATINIDNMMTGQGLEQMKSIFGAAPTEGERQILMDMQASADKTPKQRKDIMERAITAADRRMKYAEAKAKSIRDGTYLTDGAPAISETPNPSGAIKVNSDAEYNALPSGSTFIGPDGKTRRKP